MNFLMCSVGRRGELIKNFRMSMEQGSQIIAIDNSPYAPALYLADKQYLVPRIDDPSYIEVLLDICKKEKIDVITTFIDPEIMVLSCNREKFSKIGVEVLAPYEESAFICFDKYEMFKFLSSKGINTVKTWDNYDDTEEAIRLGIVSFPLFVKPRGGSGSVGAHAVYNNDGLKTAFNQDKSLVAQEFMTGEDIDADVYVDTISHKPVSIFTKRKISTTIGGANKTVSFKDPSLFSFIEDVLSVFKFNGPIDMDFFFCDGKYYLSEINPRFGGAYLHAYGAGVDFIKLIDTNLKGIVNESQIGCYEEDVVMMMYDSVVIMNSNELIR